MEMRARYEEIWLSYPEWLRREMSTHAEVGWRHSGVEILGWSWVPFLPGLGSRSSDYVSMIYALDDYGYTSRDRVIASEPEYYLNQMRKLLGILGEGVTDSIVIEGERCEGEYILRLSYSYEGEEYSFVGRGEDRLECMMMLLLEVGDHYWSMDCPSLIDVNERNIFGGQIGLVGNSAGLCDLEIVSDRDGEYSLLFDDANVARRFMSRYYRYVIEPGGSSASRLDEAIYLGRLFMMEGAARIYASLASEDLVSLYGGTISSLSGSYYSGGLVSGNLLSGGGGKP